MKVENTAIQYLDGQQLLYAGSFRAVGFNVILASLLGFYLYNHNVPTHILTIWILSLIFIIAIRMIHCMLVLKKELYISATNLNLKIFLLLTLLAGLTWTSIFFLTLPYTDNVMQFVIFIVYAGMCAGANASLGVTIFSVSCIVYRAGFI